MNIDYSMIGAKIKQARIQQNMTQAKLAEALDVSNGYISQVERGITKISLDLLGAIAAILKKDVSFFVSDSAIDSESYGSHELLSHFSKLSARDKQVVVRFIQLLLNS